MKREDPKKAAQRLRNLDKARVALAEKRARDKAAKELAATRPPRVVFDLETTYPFNGGKTDVVATSADQIERVRAAIALIKHLGGTVTF